MIFFCEDCGKKNILSPAQLKNGTAVFRCKDCNYQNSYSVKGMEEAVLKKAGDFFKSLHSFPEIIGSFLFHRKIGVLENNMPDILINIDLEILGNLLTQNILSCRSQYPEVDEMALIMANKHMIVKMMDENSAIIIASKIFPLSKTIMDQLACLRSTDKAQNG